MRGRPSPRKRLTIAGIAVLALAAGARAEAGERVIPASAGPRIFAALKSAGPAFSLVSARVDRDAVWASLCRGGDPERCFTVQARDPRKGCAAVKDGPWCLTLSGGEVDEETRGKVLEGMGGMTEGEAWGEVEGDGNGNGNGSGDGNGNGTDGRSAHPWGIAGAMVLGPIGIGVAIGRLLRGVVQRLGRWSPATRGGIAAAVVLAAIALVPSIARVGAWDVLAAGVGAALGTVVGTAAGSAREVGKKGALGMGSVALALGLLEGFTRLQAAPAVTFPPPEEARLFFGEAPGSEACAPMYPERWPEVLKARTAGLRAGAPLVLHVGDSMVEGVGVSLDQAFPALLGVRDPEVNHVNAGFASRSLDAELMLIRSWTERLPVSRVVLYVFGYNDLAELDRAYPCCPGGPLLDDTPGAKARCPEPGRPSGVRALFAVSPAPYPVRVATARSALGRRIAAALATGGNRGANEVEGARWDRFAGLLRETQRELAAKRIPLTVVYLPARASLESSAPRETGDHALRGRVLGLAAEIGATAIDPWDALEDAVKKDGAARIYLPPPDIHFTVEGHARLAAWLAPRL